jgi:hypothetical protein
VLSTVARRDGTAAAETIVMTAAAKSSSTSE